MKDITKFYRQFTTKKQEKKEKNNKYNNDDDDNNNNKTNNDFGQNVLKIFDILYLIFEKYLIFPLTASGKGHQDQ